MSLPSQSLPVDLAKARVLAFKDRGVHYRFSFSPITFAQWRDYFNAIVTTSESTGKDTINTTDTRSAKLALVESAIMGAVGYTLPEGAILSDIPDWQTKIPLAHRLVLGDMLVATRRYVAPEGQELVGLSLGEEKIQIESNWTWSDDARAIGLAAPLVHYFETPSPDQQRRFARDSSRSKIQSGFRNSKTIWMGAQLTLIQLYDELVTRVEGYVVDGKPLDGRESIARSVDAFHKVVAASQLFAAAEVESGE